VNSSGNVDDEMLTELKTRLTSNLQVEQLQWEIQNIRESKVRSRARQSQTELMQLHRQQVLDDKAFQRYDEDRNFYKEMFRQEAEHRHGRDKTRDVISLTTAANDPYNLQQILAQQNRTIATPNHQVVQSPILQLLAQLVGSSPSSSSSPVAESSRVTTEPANKPVVDSPITPTVARDQSLPPRLPPLPTPPQPTNNNNIAVSFAQQPSSSVGIQQTIGIADRRDHQMDDSDSDSDQPMALDELKLRLERQKLILSEQLALQKTLKK
jgi:hypothetical protein